jgi:NAD(P)-dependent dehydrogenase (short-subunit alcohol dehydrogenase family)
MMLKDKVAVIYGAGGAIGGAVARAFASEGANLFLTGRHLAPVEIVAKDVVAAGGSAEAAEVDALDEQAVEEHLQSVIDKAGRVDLSFNAVGSPDANILGVPLAELDIEQFSLPITTYTRSYFLTARLAARRMVPNKSGVIMTVTTLHSRTGLPLAGGHGPAQADKEALTRELSAELAPQGIRVVGLRPQAMPESAGSRRRFLRVSRHVIGDDLGTVPGAARKHDPPTTAHDARGDGKRGGLHGFREGKRDDGYSGQLDHGQAGRLAAKQPRLC